eukprot:4312759-Prymnesium_polylepis.1
MTGSACASRGACRKRACPPSQRGTSANDGHVEGGRTAAEACVPEVRARWAWRAGERLLDVGVNEGDAGEGAVAAEAGYAREGEARWLDDDRLAGGRAA